VHNPNKYFEATPFQTLEEKERAEEAIKFVGLELSSNVKLNVDEIKFVGLELSSNVKLNVSEIKFVGLSKEPYFRTDV
jgi:hypothetical protein